MTITVGRDSAKLETQSVLSALPFAVIVVDQDTRIYFLNGAAEQFFAQGASSLVGKCLIHILPKHSPLCSLVMQAHRTRVSVAEYDVTVHLFGDRSHNLTITAAPVMDHDDLTVVSMHEHSNVRLINNHSSHRSAARSVNGLAALLAHEVKNPLSGIRGAAQLLAASVSDEDRNLTTLICEETDRICGLVDRMDLFSEPALSRAAVNIHLILGRVKQIAEAGFGKEITFVEEYDPSLPPVWGNDDQLIQVFLNIIKNACEAITETKGKVLIRTGYQHGIRLAGPGGAASVPVPLVVKVSDNGCGISADVASNLFDPFVTSKRDGSGLGLALVAKVIGEHGGLIDFKTSDNGTEFNICLPAFTEISDKCRNTAGR